MAIIDSLLDDWEMGEASGNALDSQGTNPLTDNFSVGSAAGIAGVGTSRQFASASFRWLSHVSNATLQAGDTNWALNLWLYFDAIAAFQFVGAKGYADGGANAEWVFLTLGAATPLTLRVFQGGGASSTDVTNTNGGAPSTGNWNMYTLWHDATNNELGICKNAGTPDTVSYSAGVNAGTSDFLLGASGGGNYFDGRMQYARWFRKIPTSGERTLLYNAGLGLSHAAIVAEAGPAALPFITMLGAKRL